MEMGPLSIASAEFDPRSKILHFQARAGQGRRAVTIISHIRLPSAPKGETATRWAIMRRSAELLKK
jgi:hypothetical protein